MHALYAVQLKHQQVTTVSHFRKQRDARLEGQVVVLLLLVGTQGVPPLAQDLADRPIVLVGVALVHQSPVALAEDHERVHWAADVVFLPLGEGAKRGSSFAARLPLCAH